MPRWGWAALLFVTAVGGFLRFWRLDRPHKLVFDETYYVKEGYNYLKVGYELAWNGTGTQVDAKWAAGDLNVFTNQPDFVVHPPVGKWMVAFGEWIFGPDSSWGWRFSACVCGTLAILMTGLIARRLFRSTLLGVVAAVLLCVEGEEYVHSRTGLLDIFVMFWALAAFGCLVIDRDSGRRKLAARVAARLEPGGPGPGLGRFGPGVGVRWWRIAGAVCLGLCCGTKWSGVYFLAAFGLMMFFWDASARRALGVRRWFTGALLRDGLLAGVVVLPIALAVYLASWTGWFLSSNAYDRQWAADHHSKHFQWVPGALRSLWFYHGQMYQANIHLDASHPYKTDPWSWIVMGRPTAFFYEGPKLGQSGCKVATCSEAVTALGNPVIWWGGTLALAVLLFRWALRRDWRAGAVLAGIAGGYLPWFLYQARTIYTFYSVAFVPWMVLALTYVLGMMLGAPTASRRRRRNGAWAAGSVVVVAVLAFWFFLPIYDAQVIPQSSWSARMWFQSWI
jgi:dolichyl-phosphate-mannose--protein O-mannosyl transferase